MANARSHIPIPLSIYFPYSRLDFFLSFARSLSIIDLLELVRGKIIKFNASKPEIDGLFISNEWSQARKFQCNIHLAFISFFISTHMHPNIHIQSIVLSNILAANNYNLLGGFLEWFGSWFAYNGSKIKLQLKIISLSFAGTPCLCFTYSRGINLVSSTKLKTLSTNIQTIACVLIVPKPIPIWKEIYLKSDESSSK